MVSQSVLIWQDMMRCLVSWCGTRVLCHLSHGNTHSECRLKLRFHCMGFSDVSSHVSGAERAWCCDMLVLPVVMATSLWPVLHFKLMITANACMYSSYIAPL